MFIVRDLQLRKFSSFFFNVLLKYQLSMLTRLCFCCCFQTYITSYLHQRYATNWISPVLPEFGRDSLSKEFWKWYIHACTMVRCSLGDVCVCVCVCTAHSLLIICNNSPALHWPINNNIYIYIKNSINLSSTCWWPMHTKHIYAWKMIARNTCVHPTALGMNRRTNAVLFSFADFPVGSYDRFGAAG